MDNIKERLALINQMVYNSDVETLKRMVFKSQCFTLATIKTNTDLAEMAALKKRKERTIQTEYSWHGY